MDESVVRHLEQRNEVADVLRRARALVDTPEKWANRAACGKQHCAGNAIWRAEGGFGAICRADTTDAEAMFCKAIGVPGFFSIYRWNDAPERTHADVVAAFDKAIAMAEQRHA